MEPVLLFRKSLASRYELRHAEKYFCLEESRVSCRDKLVIGRYSVVPFYDELARDLALVGARLVNTLDEHTWITSFAYYRQLAAFTPATWNDDDIHACTHPSPFVVKGKMSSKKHNWDTHMFARTNGSCPPIGPYAC